MKIYVKLNKVCTAITPVICIEFSIMCKFDLKWRCLLGLRTLVKMSATWLSLEINLTWILPQVTHLLIKWEINLTWISPQITHLLIKWRLTSICLVWAYWTRLATMHVVDKLSQKISIRRRIVRRRSGNKKQNQQTSTTTAVSTQYFDSVLLQKMVCCFLTAPRDNINSKEDATTNDWTVSVRTCSLINIIIGKYGIKGYGLELKTMMKSAFDISKNAVDHLPMKTSWGMCELIDQIHHISDVRSSECKVMKTINNAMI